MQISSSFSEVDFTSFRASACRSIAAMPLHKACGYNVATRKDFADGRRRDCSGSYRCRYQGTPPRHWPRSACVSRMLQRCSAISASDVRTPVRSGRFKRDVKRMQRRGSDMEKLKVAINLLITASPLPQATEITNSAATGTAFATFMSSRIGC